MTKKDDKDEEQSLSDQLCKTEQPKLLTKPKQPETQPITIAAREGSENSILSSSPTQKSVTLAKELLGPAATEQSTEKALTLSQPIDIITNHYHLNAAALSYLNDTNDNFFVVGIIGGQGTGKSTFLNLLCPKDKDVDLKQFYFKEKNGVFPTQPKEQTFSATPTTEGKFLFLFVSIAKYNLMNSSIGRYPNVHHRQSYDSIGLFPGIMQSIHEERVCTK